MKIKILLYSLLIFSFSLSFLYAGDNTALRPISSKDIPEFLNIAVPVEYAEFNKVSTEGDELATCKSVLALLDKVYQQQQERPLKVKINRPAGVVELMAWKLVIHVYKSSTDPAGKALIKEAWNKYLEMDRENRSPQLNALSKDWDDSLMTDESIEVFKTTLDPMTIHGFTMVFIMHGEDKELALLVDKLASVEANLMGNESAYSVAHNNIRMAIDAILNWKYCGERAPKPGPYK